MPTKFKEKHNSAVQFVDNLTYFCIELFTVALNLHDRKMTDKNAAGKNLEHHTAYLQQMKCQPVDCSQTQTDLISMANVQASTHPKSTK